MSEVKVDRCVLREAFDALAAQRDEGLAREAELQHKLERHEASAQTLNEVLLRLRGERNALQQRLAEAQKLNHKPVAWMYKRHGAESKLGMPTQFLALDSKELTEVREGIICEGRVILHHCDNRYDWVPLIAASPGCADGKKS